MRRLLFATRLKFLSVQTSLFLHVLLLKTSLEEVNAEQESGCAKDTIRNKSCNHTVYSNDYVRANDILNRIPSKDYPRLARIWVDVCDNVQNASEKGRYQAYFIDKTGQSGFLF